MFLRPLLLLSFRTASEVGVDLQFMRRKGTIKVKVLQMEKGPECKRGRRDTAKPNPCTRISYDQ